MLWSPLIESLQLAVDPAFRYDTFYCVLTTYEEKAQIKNIFAVPKLSNNSFHPAIVFKTETIKEIQDA